MKQLLLILNPTAGTKKANKYLSEIISVFNRADYDTHVYVTKSKGDAVNAVKQFGNAFDIIVCCGGDGTLNEVVTGIIEADFHIPIGYIPAGSTNDFANTLKLPSNVVKAAKQIVEGSEHSYDVGKFGDRYFTYVASVGAFTQTSYTTPQNAKNAFGHIAYVLEGIQELSKIRKEHLKIQLNDEAFEDDFIFFAVCNSTSVGGIISLKPDIVDMSDGKFEVLMIRYPDDMIALGDCINAMLKQNFDSNMVTLRSSNSVKITIDSQSPWSLDGEKANGKNEILIENLHGRVTLIH